MTPATPTTGFRLPRELLDRIDAYASRLAESAGVRISRAAAVTKLLTTALDHEESDRPKRSTSRAPRR